MDVAIDKSLFEIGIDIIQAIRVSGLSGPGLLEWLGEWKPTLNGNIGREEIVSMVVEKPATKNERLEGIGENRILDDTPSEWEQVCHPKCWASSLQARMSV